MTIKRNNWIFEHLKKASDFLFGPFDYLLGPLDTSSGPLSASLGPLSSYWVLRQPVMAHKVRAGTLWLPLGPNECLHGPFEHLLGPSGWLLVPSDRLLAPSEQLLAPLTDRREL